MRSGSGAAMPGSDISGNKVVELFWGMISNQPITIGIDRHPGQFPIKKALLHGTHGG
jgi:hypothetical protein